MIAAVNRHLRARSAILLASIEGGLDRLAAGWLALVVAACAVRIATSPLHGMVAPTSLLAYLLLAAAPLISAGFALRWFAADRPEVRLVDSPGWKAVTLAEARRHPLFGAGGIMVSLLVGLLLTVPIRAAEYFAALPALSGSVPPWLAVLQLAMTIDVVLFTSLYAIAFVAALRHSPWFPRLLMLVWAADLLMQLGIAQAVAGQPDLPATVSAALHRLLDGNVLKVMLSIALWLPYLLVSTRVNLTYRRRLPR